jgi:hypothetical protein
MIELTEDQVPILSKSFLNNDELVMIGVVEEGVILQYVERDSAYVVFWDEVITLVSNVLVGKDLESNRTEIPQPRSRKMTVKVKEKKV